jgi:hypothetical protein
MFELMDNYSIFLPIASVFAAILVFQRRQRKKNTNEKRSLGMFLFGFLMFGILFFVVGFFIGADIYCDGSEYAECTLGGVFVGGPVCFYYCNNHIFVFLGIERAAALTRRFQSDTQKAARR